MEVMIERAQVSTISISGKMNEAMQIKIAEVLQAAKQCKGRILQRQDFEDGIFLEVFFENEEAKKLWENEIGLR